MTETVAVTEEKPGRLGSLQYLVAVIFVVGWSAVICGGFAVQFLYWVSDTGHGSWVLLHR